MLRNLNPAVYSKDKFIIRNTGGTGNARTKLVTFGDALILIMVLPGKIAAQTRAQFAHILTRYMAGDQSMHDDINANAASDGSIPTMAREALKEDGWTEKLKRKREELEWIKMDEEGRMLTQQRIAAEHENSRNMIEIRKTLIDDLSRLSNPDGSALEERARLLLKDDAMNQLLNQQAQNTSSPAAGHSPNKPISIASVAKELGYKLSTSDAKKIGIDLKKRYMRAHDGNAPPKHEQLCNGLVMKINSYSEQDRSLVEQAIRAHFEAGSSDEEDCA